MTIKEQLLQELETVPESLIAETLDFLRFLKAKQSPDQPKHTPANDDTEFWQQASQTSLATIWDNPEDDVYAQLL